MSSIFARLLEEGGKQQQQLKQLVAEPKTEAVVFEKPESDSTTARQQAVQTAPQHDSTLSRQHDSTHEYIASFLHARAQNKTTLRYPQALMNELDEVIYQCKKTYKVSLSKNEIFVLALGYVMGDFKRHATRSELYKELIQDKEK